MSEVIAAGPPPLTQEAADRSLDLVDFMAAVVRGVDLIEVTPDMRARWRAYLVAQYPNLSPTERAWYATADSAYATVCSGWASFTDEQREANRANWALTIPSVLRFAQPVLQGEAAAPAAAVAPAAPAAAPGSVGALIASMQQGQQAREEEAFTIAGGGEQGELAKARVQAENQRLNMQVLTEMSKLRYESMMDVWKR